MALDAGEVFVVLGARLDNASLAKGQAAFKAQKDASDQATAAIARNAELQKAASAKASAAFAESSASYAASAKRGEDAANRLSAANDRWKSAAVTGAKVAAVGFGSVVAALGGAAIAAASFDSSMRNVNSIAGLSEKGFKSLEQQVLHLSTAVGKSPTDLANGLYSIVSSGFKAQDAMKILTAGARAARAGLTDTATATGSITQALNAYGLGAKDAKRVSDLLFEGVNFGVQNFTQLAGSIGKVLPQGKALGVSLSQLLAAQAALTRGNSNADESSTQLGQIFTSLVKPSKGLSAALKDMGYESGQAAIAHLGLKGTLDELGKAADGNQATLAKWFGNIRAFRGIAGLEGTAHDVAQFTASVKAMDDATKGAGETQAVYNEQQKSTSAQFDHLKAAIDVAAVTIGSALLPEINQGIGALTKWFAAAQKSGELNQWAQDIATDVKDVISYLHSLGPEAEQAFHVISATIQSAIPFVEDLYRIFQEISPEIEDIAHAASGLAQAFGPGPILGALATYALLRRGMLTTQVAMGGFAKVMQAGQLSIARSIDGGVKAGKITAIGEEAVATESTFKVAAAGIVSSFGPTLLVAGAAGIVGSLLYIRSTMTSLKDEARDVVEALAQLEGAKTAKAAARIAVGQQKQVVSKAQGAAESAAVGTNKAFDAVFQAQGTTPAAELAAQRNLDAAYSHQRDTILNLQSAKNQLKQDQQDLTTAAGKEAEAQKKLGDQLTGLAQKAQGAQGSGAGASFLGSDAARKAAAAANTRDQQQAVDKLANSIRNAAAASTSLDAAGKGAANRMADVIQALDLIPSKKQTTIIADDIAAGKSIANIKKDLGIVGTLKPKPTIDADAGPIVNKLSSIQTLLAKILLPHTIPLSLPDAPTVKSALDDINTRILHLTQNPWKINVQYATSGSLPSAPGGGGKTGHFNAKGQWVYSAEGRKVTKPTLSVSGEDGDEYIIPVSQKHKASGMELWLAAGRDLGVQMNAAGKKPGKTPPPIKHGLGYDPAALDAQQAAEKTRLTNARSFRDTLAGRVKTDTGHEKTLEKEITTAQGAVSKANARPEKTASEKASKAAAQKTANKRLSTLQAELKKLEKQLADERKAHDHQVNVVIPAEVKRYEAATRAATIGDDHAKKITLWQDRADSDTNAMGVASDQWDAANRKGDKKGMAAAYTAWDNARKARITDLNQAKTLIQEVANVVGKTDYGAQIAGQLSTAIDDIVNANDLTQAPGYEAPDTSGPSTDINDYLYPEEIAAQQQAALDLARAATTPDLNDDQAAAHEELGVATWIAGRLQQDGAPIDIITQALQAVAQAQGDVSSAAAAITSATGAVNGVTADQQAQIDQANANATAANENASSAASALQAFQQSGDLFGGGGLHIENHFSTLTADNPSVQRALSDTVVRSIGNQPAVASSRGFYNG